VDASTKLPFTIIKANQRRISSANGTVSFKAPAPAGSMLRFSAIGSVTVDGKSVTPQRTTTQSELLNTYSVPIAAGKQSVSIGMSCHTWYCGPYQAKDFHIWSRGQGAPSSPAATSTATPRPPATASPNPATPTRTATPGGGGTPIPAPTRAVTQPAQWTTKANLSTSSLKRGATQTVSVLVTASSKSTALIDIEIYGPNGDKVFQKFYDNINFATGTPKTIKASWDTPSNVPTGTYSVRIGIFKPGWGQLYHWNNYGGTFTIKQ
jgi:hypothetical protein